MKLKHKVWVKMQKKTYENMIANKSNKILNVQN